MRFLDIFIILKRDSFGLSRNFSELNASLCKQLNLDEHKVYTY